MYRKRSLLADYYYVYTIRDPRPGMNLCIRYIGSGRGSRAWWYARLGLRRRTKTHNYELQKMLDECSWLKLHIPIKIIELFSTKEAARKKEEFLIAYCVENNINLYNVTHNKHKKRSIYGTFPTKICERCSNKIRAAAKVCRFCGYGGCIIKNFPIK